MQTDRKTQGILFNVQKYSVHDGPGIRTILFLKGCSLRCRWCSNPESQRLEPELAFNRDKCLGEDHCQRCHSVCPNQALGVAQDGKMHWIADNCRQCHACAQVCPNKALIVYGYKATVEQALRWVEEDEAFYSRSGGGVTLSGGEPLVQSDFALALLRESKRRRIHTCIETCGMVPWHVIREAAQHLDHVLYDVKLADSEKHRAATGAGNEVILDNLRRLKREYPNLPITVRTPVIPGINDTPEDIRSIAQIVKDLGGTRYELLGYHRMGTPKYVYLGRSYGVTEQNLPEERLGQLRALARQVLTGAEETAQGVCAGA
ncbi:pyruvate formate lyase activating enzyme [Desulfacinum hydrothermale DSM 13146]|uniref:Pyruvate formate lyase activating enzyme n=1 Tax=Desulfacinum hydrothermale DSM 13146 TaxID=1121390 RepID=A0A1W1XEY2_9BACT|nr:pyruvate formate lyase activating enzyme [Desulfacinum hydrothermale DSM 13146]